MKQTAVEWLVNELDLDMDLDSKWIIEQAKEMEKQQIIEARITAPLLPSIDKLIYLNEAEYYYNETFNKEV